MEATQPVRGRQIYEGRRFFLVFGKDRKWMAHRWVDRFQHRGGETRRDINEATHVIVDEPLAADTIIVPAEADYRNKQYGPDDLARIVRNFGDVKDDTGKVIAVATKKIVSLAWAIQCFDMGVRLPEDNWIIRGRTRSPYPPPQGMGWSPASAGSGPWAFAPAPPIVAAAPAGPTGSFRRPSPPPFPLNYRWHDPEGDPRLRLKSQSQSDRPPVRPPSPRPRAYLPRARPLPPISGGEPSTSAVDGEKRKGDVSDDDDAHEPGRPHLRLRIRTLSSPSPSLPWAWQEDPVRGPPLSEYVWGQLFRPYGTPWSFYWLDSGIVGRYGGEVTQWGVQYIGSFVKQMVLDGGGEFRSFSEAEYILVPALRGATYENPNFPLKGRKVVSYEWVEECCRRPFRLNPDIFLVRPRTPPPTTDREDGSAPGPST